jgi:hypothetical protein
VNVKTRVSRQFIVCLEASIYEWPLPVLALFMGVECEFCKICVKVIA